MTRQHDSTSVRTAAIVIGFSIASLAIFITLSNLLAPDKPNAPENSTITFETPPPLEIPQFDFDPVPLNYASDSNDEEPYHDETYATITGTVTDLRSDEPISDVRVAVQWKRNDPEQVAYEEYSSLLLNNDSINGIKDLNLANNEFSDHQIVRSDSDGAFTIYIPLNRKANFGFSRKGYLTEEIFGFEIDTDEKPEPLDIKLSTGASISGRIFNVATNEGIEGMYLNIDPSPVAQSYQQFKTNADGTYLISGLTPRQYEIRVDHFRTRYNPGKILPFQRLTIRRPKDDITGIDFGLTRAGVVWGYTRTPEDNLGIQTDLALVGSENIITQGINNAMNEFKGENRVLLASSNIKRDGYYEFAGVPLDKEWRVFATSEDRAPQLSDSFILTSASPDIRVDVNMLNGSTVYGIVVDEDGYAVPKANILCIPGVEEIFAPLNSAKTVRDDQSEEDGQFIIDDLPSGSYNLYAFKEGYKVTIRGTPIFPNGETDLNNIVLELHQIIDDKHIAYGIVSDRSGNPIEGASLSLGGFSLDDIMSSKGENGERNATTNEYGEFLFEDLSVGTYMMMVEKEGYADKFVTKVWLDKPTNVSLGGGSKISGTVYSHETKRPFTQSFSISARPEIKLSFNIENPLEFLENMSSSAGQKFSDTDGRFELVVNPGTYTLRASSPGYVSDEFPLIIGENETVDNIRLYLSKSGATIEGRVRTADASSPQGAQVRLTKSLNDLMGFMDGDFQNESTTVGADGRFTFTGVPNGSYVILASHPSYATAQHGPVVVSSADGPTSSGWHSVGGIEMVLGGGGTLEGNVFNRGSAVQNVQVMILSAADPIATSTDENGYYRITGLSPGEHHVIAISTFGFNSDTLQSQMGDTVIIEEGRTTQLNLELTEMAVP